MCQNIAVCTTPCACTTRLGDRRAVQGRCAAYNFAGTYNAMRMRSSMRIKITYVTYVKITDKNIQKVMPQEGGDASAAGGLPIYEGRENSNEDDNSRIAQR